MSAPELVELSPPELFMDLVDRLTSRDVVPHVVVGPAQQVQQQEGVVSITPAGQGVTSAGGRLVGPRMQLRCVHPELARVDAIGNHVAQSLDGITRVVCRQASTGTDYLIHFVNVTGGPSLHYDTEATWEALLFCECLIGKDPVT